MAQVTARDSQVFDSTTQLDERVDFLFSFVFFLLTVGEKKKRQGKSDSHQRVVGPSFLPGGAQSEMKSTEAFHQVHGIEFSGAANSSPVGRI